MSLSFITRYVIRPVNFICVAVLVDCVKVFCESSHRSSSPTVCKTLCISSSTTAISVFESTSQTKSTSVPKSTSLAVSTFDSTSLCSLELSSLLILLDLTLWSKDLKNTDLRNNSDHNNSSYLYNIDLNSINKFPKIKSKSGLQIMLINKN
ncbi:hypothetical protein BpHYR1_003780 [Brachionus plicatilis]|uniref:Uncharacterized protein n=1 Tax=Brachionus plicatilis TaxID=10195 RepID=A0A3M7RSA0_BRAPC|nr:hypothetical protein BpHYR1_003780 [Brachionus plicatilis]